MGLTKEKRAERAAIKAGTYEEAHDEFGNRYLVATGKQPDRVCVHCGGKVEEIVGSAIMPGNMPPFRHSPGVGLKCPKRYGPLETSDVKDV